MFIFQALKSLSESLRNQSEYSCSQGEQEVNRKKNRYKDILPCKCIFNEWVTHFSVKTLVGVRDIHKEYSLMNMRQLHILFNSAKTWHVIVCWFLCFSPNLPELNPKLFCSDVQNNFRFSSGKFRAKHRNRNHQTITCHFWLN